MILKQKKCFIHCLNKQKNVNYKVSSWNFAILIMTIVTNPGKEYDYINLGLWFLSGYVALVVVSTFISLSCCKCHIVRPHIRIPLFMMCIVIVNLIVTIAYVVNLVQNDYYTACLWWQMLIFITETMLSLLYLVKIYNRETQDWDRRSQNSTWLNYLVDGEWLTQDEAHQESLRSSV